MRCLSRRTVTPNRLFATGLRFAWRARLVPTALALFVVQIRWRSASRRHEMDSDSRQWFIHANDAIGVRSRAKVLAALVEKYIHNESENNWVSSPAGRPFPCLRRCATQSSTANRCT